MTPAADPAAAKTPAKPGGGKAAPAERYQPGFFEILFSGGPIGVAIMLVLIGLSLTAAYFVFENAMTVRESELIPPELGDNVRRAVQGGKWDEAEALCRAQPSFLAFVLSHGIGEIEGGWTAVEKALEEALAEQAARLFRKVDYLNVIGNIAPMVGLLGTVVGMLLSFYTLATSGGKAGAVDLAEGIYQALVTTVVGLIIAIPSLGAFAYFRNRADELVAQTAYVAQHAFAPVRRAAMAAAGAASLPMAPTPAPPPSGRPAPAKGVAVAPPDVPPPVASPPRAPTPPTPPAGGRG